MNDDRERSLSQAPTAATTGIDSGISASRAAARSADGNEIGGVAPLGSVSLALYVAFWLELYNAHGAGTSVAIVCQPSLCAAQSLVPRDQHRRWSGGDRGPDRTFPQNRIGFLMGLAAHIPWPSFSEWLQWPPAALRQKRPFRDIGF